MSSTGLAHSSHSTRLCRSSCHLALHGQLPRISSWVRVSQDLSTSGPVQWISSRPPGSRTNLEHHQHPGLQPHVPIFSKALREDLSQILTPRALLVHPEGKFFLALLFSSLSGLPWNCLNFLVTALSKIGSPSASLSSPNTGSR